jgi:hypothetical protein
MHHITEIPRQKMRISGLEDTITPDNEVLIILGLAMREREGKYKKTTQNTPQKKEDYKSSYYSL